MAITIFFFKKKLVFLIKSESHHQVGTHEK